MIEIIFNSIPSFWPEITMSLTFVVGMIVEFSTGRKDKPSTGMTTGLFVLAGFVITILQLPFQNPEPRLLFDTMYTIDPFALFFKYLILATGIVIIVFSMQSAELRKQGNIGEFFCFIAAMTFGMLLMTGASHLLMIYLAIEVVSISSFILAGFSKKINRSSEAALKYVLFGGAASGVMLYGMSLLYGMTGALDIYSIQSGLASGVFAPHAADFGALMLAIIMILVGFGYKISAVPFHFWTPDVYEGAPITVTAYLAVASKAAGFAILIRFFYVTFFDSMIDIGKWVSLPHFEWNIVLAVLSVLTMTLGNVIAVWQDNLKRLLAYSSIAHAGYILMGAVVMTDLGISAMLVYFVIYFFMNLGAFYVVMAVADRIGSEHIDDYRGLGKRAPIISVGLSVFLVSLTGLPPLAGFIGKWMLFSAVVEANFIWLAVIGVINSAISLYYYARIFRNMYLREPMNGDTSPITFSPLVIVTTILFIVPNVVLGLYFGPLISYAQQSVQIFLR
ncbi:MAG: NADH-quinone oxidoreductase subunit N [Bacteroidetes bacterium]|nr:NADH-quinone oxidoreductase subunit N [Bacteroidota bacterium]